MTNHKQQIGDALKDTQKRINKCVSMGMSVRPPQKYLSQRLVNLETVQTALKVLAAACDDTWQPIDSAPKDGTRVLLVRDNREPWIGFWPKHRTQYEKMLWQECVTGKNLKPTHWKSLESTTDKLVQQFIEENKND